MNKRPLRPDKRGDTSVAKNIEKLWNKEEAKLGEKISLNELAGDIGIAQSILWRIYTGESVDPKDSTIAPIADHFEVSIPQLRGHNELPLTSSTSARARMLARKIDNLTPPARKVLTDLLEVLLVQQQTARKIG